jgi:hypothetical protein
MMPVMMGAITVVPKEPPALMTPVDSPRFVSGMYFDEAPKSTERLQTPEPTVLQSCHSGETVMLQRRYSGVAVMSQCC